MDRAIDILAMGEPLMEFSEREQGGVRVYLPGHGGDTSNCAVAAARQGAKAACFTAVGDDAFGRSFLELWDAEGVDRSRVLVRPDARTGVYFISYGAEGHAFSYHRAGSAASLVAAAEVPADLVASARVLHVSGISQAISLSACDAVFHAIRLAKRAGALVSYDTNLRLALWPLDRARAVIHAALSLADIALPGLDDARQLTGLAAPDAICDRYLGVGVKIVALTLGAAGTLVANPDRRERVPARKVEAVDATGAGDTFDGAFLAEHLRTGDPFRAAAYANAAAALSTQGHGAVAPMPRRPQVEAFLAGAG
jgi:2-dehydro-3-deoxygluconokinase